MISEAKHRNALAALNSVLVYARSLAYEGRSREVADVLDVAEYLPMLMLESRDRTSEFRGQLVDLAQTHPGCTRAVERFDSVE